MMDGCSSEVKAYGGSICVCPGCSLTAGEEKHFLAFVLLGPVSFLTSFLLPPRSSLTFSFRLALSFCLARQQVFTGDAFLPYPDSLLQAAPDKAAKPFNKCVQSPHK